MTGQDLFDCPWNAGRPDARDHRDDAQPGRGIVFGIPFAIVLWLILIGVGGAIAWAVSAWVF